MKITHGSLFTGLGGFDLAAARCDITTLWQCEKNSFCRKVLDMLYPGVPIIKDIYGFDCEKVETPTIISGGFPCQDISVNGTGAGIFGNRSRTVFKMLEIIERLRPRFAVFENSPILLKRGLETILRLLAAIGYNAEWRCVSAAFFGYKHKRERLFVVAYPHVPGQEGGVFKPEKTVPVHVYTPSEAYILLADKGMYSDGNYYDICGISGLPRNFRKIIGGLGNAVNATCAEYVIRCIVEFIKEHEYETGH